MPPKYYKKKSIDIMQKYNLAPKKMSAGYLVLAGALLFMSTTFTLGIIYQFSLSPFKQMIKENIHTKGVIIDRYWSHSMKNSSEYVKYKYQVNNMVYTNSEIISENIASRKLKVGDKTKVIYDKKNPQKSLLAVNIITTIGIIKFIFLDIILAVLGIIILVVFIKNNKKFRTYQSINSETAG
jgi:hypothetical protein